MPRGSIKSDNNTKEYESKSRMSSRKAKEVKGNMNACFDERLSKEAKKGFIVFLHAEAMRHQGDIDAIFKRIKETEDYLGLTGNERVELYRMGHKYVEI